LTGCCRCCAANPTTCYKGNADRVFQLVGGLMPRDLLICILMVIFLVLFGGKKR
jgi:hypothetical protein